MDTIKRFAYDFKHKRTAAILLLVIIGLVLFNNISERDNLSNINNAANAIYEDRFLPESYIFKYYQQSENIIDIANSLTISDDDKSQGIAKNIVTIEALNVDYLKTKLTKAEENEFNQLQNIFAEMTIANKANNLNVVKALALASRSKLHRLSDIQLTEAETQIKNIRKLNSSTMMSLKFEIFLILIIGLIVQALIFASRTIPNLNTAGDKSAWN